ncbi:hypothetical protein FEM48_Zijuj05G0024200 [Ziziphus jujuba var. spinosa]|uniref:Uncharacterized protein n=1 Tax=Ziziphus jujuba var. spinosa TaxID=714518 RepID=A0A978VC98_ZIZJJ|nr:hypothetical protein FEM48_Zijuj05G0024200 [Ziziphus jujuba var. spinosa]
MNHNRGEVVSSIAFEGNRSSSQHLHDALKRYQGRRLKKILILTAFPEVLHNYYFTAGLRKVSTTHNIRSEAYEGGPNIYSKKRQKNRVPSYLAATGLSLV